MTQQRYKTSNNKKFIAFQKKKCIGIMVIVWSVLIVIKDDGSSINLKRYKFKINLNLISTKLSNNVNPRFIPRMQRELPRTGIYRRLHLISTGEGWER